MHEHEAGAETPRAILTAIPIGTFCGALLFVLGGCRFGGLDHGLGRLLSAGIATWHWQEVRDWLLLPTTFGGLAGSAVACAVWVTNTWRHVPRSVLVLSWALLGGVVLILVPTGGILFYPSVFGHVS